MTRSAPEPALFFPAPPDGGGFLVLNRAQMSDPDLLSAIRSIYPQTRIIAQAPIPPA
jgi:hypothetical protein